ncbi:RNA methyltransferase [Lyngbya sp. CCY1209]|uniref:TrmH family RNA methyltransferase n=1 Tax=Lyngbya sp. CCY1209 TaxID=2886103 RepID=UPI002D207689|nr:RNA methyltransferase [Lyngbya sp. CCY1209]MEB3884271.1 RNA methyltransferase [Lyngbya sp. CCY1209]
MNPEQKRSLINHLQEFATPERSRKIQTILRERTRQIAVVLEDLYQPHNASACLRSCDSFGIQDVHIIENRNRFDLNREVSVGSDRWLTLHRYNRPDINNTETCLNSLKKQGYLLVATTPHTDDISIHDLPLDRKIALMFGTELTGLSDGAISRADRFVKIPMFGFSESFNISVSVALCLYETTTRLREQPPQTWGLSEAEILDLEVAWLRQSIRGGPQIEARFLSQSSC